MLHIPITDLDLPELQPYRTLRRQEEHYRQRIFVAEGEKTLRRLLATEFVVISVLITEEWLKVFEPLLKNRPEEIRGYIADKSLLENLIGFTMFQGVMAVAKIPECPSLEQILERSGKPNLLVATDGVGNAENLGTLVRNCAAFSVDALFVSRSSSSPFLRRAVRSSMGGVFTMPVLEELDLVDTFRQLRERKVRCIGAHPHAAGRTLPELDLTGDSCIVFGNEAHGISEAVLAVCDDVAAVPMPAHVDSLNVSSAGAVFLYEAWRQRGSRASRRA